jgi:nucleoside phosphorylase
MPNLLDQDDRQHTIEFEKVLNSWEQLRLASHTSLHILARFEPADAQTLQARDIIAGLKAHGTAAARFVAHKTDSSESKAVLWWVEEQLAESFSRDNASANAFHQIRLIVRNALLQVDSPGRDSPGSAPRPDIVLFTVNKHETQAVHDAFRQATGAEGVPVSLAGRLYHDLGAINGTTVYHATSEMGSGGPGGMQQSVDKAIRALDPGAVLAVGIAFGVSEKDQSIGDILLSEQLRLYELQRAGAEIILRGDKPHATSRLINHFKTFSDVKWKGAKVRPGLVMSGEKLIDNLDYRDQLVKLEVEAVGGEMEGAGLYVSSHEHKVDWVVVKAICDWADGNKKRNKARRQKKAATNAVEFVVESLKYAALKRV